MAEPVIPRRLATDRTLFFAFGATCAEYLARSLAVLTIPPAGASASVE
jgi:hypothetical protein